jgi:WD40 repeat protein
LFVWDLKTNKQVAHLSGVTWPFRFNTDSTLLVVRDQFYDDVFKIYNIASGEEQTFSAPEKDKSQIISSAEFSSDGKLLAIGSRSTHLWLWDLRQQKNIADLEADYNYGVLDVLFSPDGQTLVAWGEAKMYIWDLSTRTKRSLEGFGYDHIGANFSPNSKLLATWDYSEAGYNQVRLWDISSGAKLNSFSHQWPFKFNPQGTELASINDDGQIVIWGAAK